MCQHTSRVSAANWTTLENTGCVFIPACGVRVGSTVTYSPTSFMGNYWTSTRGDCTWPIAGGGEAGQPKGTVNWYFYMVYGSIDGGTNYYNYFRTGEANLNTGHAFAVRLARNAN